MLIEMYFSSEAEQAIETYKLVVDIQRRWRQQVLEFCQSIGFQNFSGCDFIIPSYYYRSRLEHVQRVSGFSIVKDPTLLLPDPESLSYVLRVDNEPGRVAYRHLEEISQSAFQDLGISADAYGKPEQLGYQKAICLLLGVYYAPRIPGVNAFSQVWLVKDLQGKPRLLCSIPVATTQESSVYAVPPIPGEWRDINSREFISLINNHNARFETDNA